MRQFCSFFIKACKNHYQKNPQRGFFGNKMEKQKTLQITRSV
jgi:hypothetical protein